MSQTTDHEVPLRDWATGHDVVDSGFSRAIVMTDEGSVVARDWVLAQAAAALIASRDRPRTVRDLLEVVRMPLEVSTV